MPSIEATASQSGLCELSFRHMDGTLRMFPTSVSAVASRGRARWLRDFGRRRSLKPAEPSLSALVASGSGGPCRATSSRIDGAARNRDRRPHRGGRSEATAASAIGGGARGRTPAPRSEPARRSRAAADLTASHAERAPIQRRSAASPGAHGRFGAGHPHEHRRRARLSGVGAPAGRP